MNIGLLHIASAAACVRDVYIESAVCQTFLNVIFAASFAAL